MPATATAQTTNNPLSRINTSNDKVVFPPKWQLITGSAKAAILLSQVIYWWQKMKMEPFYKFREPCNHPLYRDADSWAEELCISAHQFDAALKKIGFKVTAATRETIDHDMPIEYWVSIDRVTYYAIVSENLNNFLDKVDELSGKPPVRLVKPEPKTKPKTKPKTEPKPEKKIEPKVEGKTEGGPGKPAISINLKTRTTKTKEPGLHIKGTESNFQKNNNVENLGKSGTENSTEKTKTVEVSSSYSLLIDAVKGTPSKQIRNMIARNLKKHGFDYVYEAIMYANANSNKPGKYKSYLGQTLDKGWADGYLGDLEKARVEAEEARARVEQMRSEAIKIAEVDAGLEAEREIEREARRKADDEKFESLMSADGDKYREDFYETLSQYEKGRFKEKAEWDNLWVQIRLKRYVLEQCKAAEQEEPVEPVKPLELVKPVESKPELKIVKPEPVDPEPEPVESVISEPEYTQAVLNIELVEGAVVTIMDKEYKIENGSITKNGNTVEPNFLRSMLDTGLAAYKDSDEQEGV